MKSFTIALAESVLLDIKCRFQDNVTYYDIYANGKMHVTVYPVLSDDAGLSWLSDDNIDNSLLILIGRAIESFEA